MSEHRAQLSRVYGDETWRVYDVLDQSLDPASPDSLYDLAGVYLAAGSRVLDAGCRDAAHLIRLLELYGVTGVGVDPVEVHIERANAAIDAAGVSDRAVAFVGNMHQLPYPDGEFDFVWCRDVLAQVDDLDGALREVARVTRPGGHMLVYATFRTDLLSTQEAELFDGHLGNVPTNMIEENVEAAFRRAGFAVERKDVIGTEWREHVEEQRNLMSRSMLRLSRLRRRRKELAEHFGQDICDSIEANLHWEVFQFLGKLLPVVYILRRND